MIRPRLKPLYVIDSDHGAPIPIAKLDDVFGGVRLNCVQIDKCEISKLIAWLRVAQKLARKGPGDV
jgi:hypothetical protein